MKATFNQKDMIGFALKYPGWHSFARDKLTVEHVCANVNLGILEINQFNQFRLKSEEKAVRFMGDYIPKFCKE